MPAEAFAAFFASLLSIGRSRADTGGHGENSASGECALTEALRRRDNMIGYAPLLVDHTGLVEWWRIDRGLSVVFFAH